MIISNKMQDYIEKVSELARQMIKQELNIDAKKLRGFQIEKIVEFFNSEIEICDYDDKVGFNEEKNIYIIYLAKDREYFQSSDEEKISILKLYERKKEIIFHELGHIFLMPIFHIESERIDGEVGKTGAITAEEISADYFSRAFLMPVEDFTETVFSKTYKNVCNFYEVSKEFDVSNQAVVERGKDLMMWR